ncbi:hypothetical protein Tco_0366475 [Tanacetum coccineum]
MYSCEFCGNDARYGHYCTPQVPFIYPEQCYNQYFNFPQDFHDFQQQYLCCENCGGPHETFQCQPMNEDYYEQNSCYDPNSFGFDQFQPLKYTINHPILNAQNEFLNSQNKLMEQMTSICDMVSQIMQKKEEDRRIAEDQAAKDRYWKIPICYDDVEDYTITITPVLSTKEAVDSLIMEDEHLDTIPATESDEVIKSSIKNLVQIPSEFKGASEDTCDVLVCEDPSTFDALSNHSEILSDSNNDGTSSDDDAYENIEYDEASPLNLEIRSCNHTEETRSGSTTTHANNSLLEFESFHFDLYDDLSFPRPPPEPPDVEISLIIETDAPVINNFDELNEDECFDPGEMRLMLKMTIPLYLSFGLFSRFSLTLWNLLYLFHREWMDTIFDWHLTYPCRVGLTHQDGTLFMGS